ncbi:MAG TPA: EamA family transporter [Planctomycetaceae bacterium]|nr:EamA family transporter [Planctomycetaceae bacterium]
MNSPSPVPPKDESLFPASARGRLLLVAASILWSTSGVLVKSPPLQRLPLEDRGPLVACFRALIAACCLLPFVNWQRIRFRAALVPMVISFALMNTLFVTAMTRTTAAATIFLQYTGTGWAFLFGALFLRERITRENLVALAFGLAGIGWIVAAGWKGGDLSGIVLALGSGIGYGGVIVSLRALRAEDAIWLVVLNHLVSGLLLVPWVASRGLLPIGHQWSVLIVLGGLQMGLPYVLFCRGVASVSAQEAGLLTLLEAILNPLWVWLFWREEVPAAVWIGGGLILAGLLARYGRIARGTAGN